MMSSRLASQRRRHRHRPAHVQARRGLYPRGESYASPASRRRNHLTQVAVRCMYSIFPGIPFCSYIILVVVDREFPSPCIPLDLPPSHLLPMWTHRYHLTSRRPTSKRLSSFTISQRGSAPSWRSVHPPPAPRRIHLPSPTADTHAVDGDTIPFQSCNHPS